MAFILRIFTVCMMFGIVLSMTPVPAFAGKAPNWQALPAACLPTRMQLWQDGLPEAQQAACHCPPSSMCPKTIVDYLAALTAYSAGLDASGNVTNSGALVNTVMPPNVFNRCCPAPVCPAGTRLEGQLPPDGECNPRCPAGTQLAGQIVPADFNCNPVPMCPAGTTLAGQPVPGDGGCNRCPSGTFLSGQALPSDGICTRCPAGTYYAGHDSTGLPNQDCGYVCPAGTDLAGQLPQLTNPGWNCNLCPVGTPRAGQLPTTEGHCHGTLIPPVIPPPEPPICPWGTTEYGQPVPLDGQCNRCPAGSALAGQPMPATWICDPIPRCPEGTTFAGQPIDGTTGITSPEQCNQTGTSADGGDGGGGDCLSGDAQLVRKDGKRVSIATVAAGDELEGIDGTVTVRSVTRIEDRKAPLFYRINDLAFLITGDHPVETTEGWKTLDPEMNKDGKHYDRLEVGDVLIGKGQELVVKTIALVPQDAKKGAYNIATEGDKRLNVDGVSVKPFTSFTIDY